MAGIDLTKRADAYSLYFPSMQVGSAGYVCAAPSKWQDHPLPCGLEPKDFNFLDPDNKFWTYRYALASAENFRGKTNNAVTTRTSSAFILGDSGGYQVGTGKFGGASKWKGFSEDQVVQAWRKSPMLGDITRWCQSKCDYAMTLDIPPWTLREAFSGTPFHACRFDTLLDLTVEHLKYLDYNRGKWGKCKFLNVLQGDKPSEEDHWYNRVTPHPFDGWSLAGGVGVGGGPYRMLNRLLRLRDDGLLVPGFDWLHVLGLSRLLWAPLVTAMQMAVRANVNEKFTISYDSSNAYMVGGRDEKYFVQRQLDANYSTWTNPGVKFPTGYGNAIERRAIALNTVSCLSNPCAMCAAGEQHLRAPLMSPIASLLNMTDLVSVTDEFARRHVSHLFDQTMINHNVYVLVDATIRANDAVFGATPCAPQQLVDAVGLIKDLLFHEQDWHGMLDKNRGALEKAVRYTTPKVYLG